jgi:phenylacetate-CoA ligase
MDSWIEYFYHKSPIFLQNIMVSFYGYKLKMDRYNKNSSGYFSMLKKSENFDKNEMNRYVDEKFVTLARMAIETVPYYRRWAEENCFKASDINDISDLKKFPIVTKDVIKENPSDFISNRSKRLLKLTTSGTTGSPLTIFCSRNDRTLHYAFFTRLRSWFGIDDRSRRITLFGRIIQLPDNENPPFWRMDLAQRNLLMSSYHLSKRNLCHYYNKIKKYKPEEVIGYPSSLYEIARYVIEENLEPISCKVVFTTAETLLDYQRTILEKAFTGPIIDQYGCTEMAFFISQCEYGTLHCHPEHGYLETVDRQENLIEGEPGRLLATGFVNHSMPLIRYEIGDFVTLGFKEEACSCGRSFPVIKTVEGRLDDVIYRKDGTPVGRLDPVFKGGIGIRMAKIVQDVIGDVTVLVTIDDNFGVRERCWLNNELRKRLGKDIEINIKVVEDIPRERNGKFKAVESEFRAGHLT